MAEVGLVPFVHLALEVAAAVLPPYRTRFSKHQFTQPQLLAVLCLMRYEDWTYREVEVRLREHSELRRALGLRRVPASQVHCDEPDVSESGGGTFLQQAEYSGTMDYG